eukprot:Gb_24330 [translate_table: standard]
MGVGGGFWELLKPIAQYENLDYLRGKKVAIDLSYWIVQQETALKGNARKPHLRLTFFRTINLFAKLGVFPVFVVDGDPPALKSPARMGRFYRMTGIDFSSSPTIGSSNLARNPIFNQHIEECVMLLELLGMPVLKAKSEAEALCAWLDREGLVDACITTDSDAFLHGAECVIKCLQADCKEPIVECYRASDIDTILRLKRKHLIALALLVGCDYNVHGVPGIGLNNAVRIVHLFHEDEILSRLRELGEGNASLLSEMDTSGVDYLDSKLDGEVPVKRNPHCSNCGHPGNKGIHMKHGCEACKASDRNKNCVQKVRGFKCECKSCRQERRRKEHNKCLDWQTKVFAKIAATEGFPNEEIIDMFLSHEPGSISDWQNTMKSLSWCTPQMELLEDFLVNHLYWDRPYIRQKILPLSSALFLREMASSKAGLDTLQKNWLLCNRYALHSIQRVKVHYSQSFYVIKWKHIISESMDDDWLGLKAKVFHQQKRKILKGCNFQGGFDEDVNSMEIETVNGRLFITTDEDMELIRSACPELVEKFQQEQAVKERHKEVSKRKKVSATSTGKQLSITTYYKSIKGLKRETILPVENKEEQSTGVVLHSAIPIEKSIEGLNTLLAASSHGAIIEIDPISQDETTDCTCASATSNKGEVEIIEIESPNHMIQEPITETVRRCLF